MPDATCFAAPGRTADTFVASGGRGRPTPRIAKGRAPLEPATIVGHALAQLSERAEQTDQDRRRAIVGHPQNGGLSEEERADRGLHMLLQDLRATHITKGAFS